MIRILRPGITCFALACAAVAAPAQISLITAVDLAIKSNPKVLTAQADVDKALASMQQLRDAYIPNIVGGSGIGPPSYGFPLGQPSIFNITSTSLVFSYSQRDYMRSAKAAYDAANLSLKDAREAVAEDTAVTYLALNRDLQREAALRDQQGYADHLVNIVQQRLDAGQDTPIDLTTSRLTAAQIKLARLRAEDETAFDKAHLARLIGLPMQGITTTSESVPPFPLASNLQRPHPLHQSQQSIPPTPSLAPNSKPPSAMLVISGDPRSTSRDSTAASPSTPTSRTTTSASSRTTPPSASRSQFLSMTWSIVRSSGSRWPKPPTPCTKPT